MKLESILFTAVLVASVVTPANARQRTRQSPRPLPTLNEVGPTTVLAAVRKGGFIFACRHAITDRSGNQRGPVRLGDRSTQRNLSGVGEEQARRLGRALQTLEVPIGEVFASAYARTMESAELAFGRATLDTMLYGNHSAAELRVRFSRLPRHGNTVLMTHQGILRSALGYRQPEEGDCVVVQPLDGKPDVIANVTVEEWERLAATVVNRL